MAASCPGRKDKQLFEARRPSYQKALLLIAALALSYAIAPWLPSWAGWENVLIENAQTAMLLAGGVIAVMHGRRARGVQARGFWFIAAALWWVMCVRELSWGAVFLAPYQVMADTGPRFSSTLQLWYKPAIAPVLGLLGLVCAWRFVTSRQHDLVSRLWQQRAFPLSELLVFIAAMTASAAAEHHLGLSLPFAHEWAAQNFEELAEVWAYLALWLAQRRVWDALRRG